MSDPTGALFLGAKETEGRGAEFSVRNPATGDLLPPVFRDADLEQVAEAARLAAAASEQESPSRARTALLAAIAEEITALDEDLLVRAYAETALPMLRLQSERARTLHQIGLFAQLVEEGSWVDARIDRADPKRLPARKPDLRRMLVPLGPVAVFGASNFPLAFSVAGGDTISALAAGCPVVVKAHPAHPGTSEMVARAIARAVARVGVHEGTFSMVHGSSNDVGLALVRAPELRAVGFTGSLRGGRALFDAAAARPDPIPVFAEMGSQNPVFLLTGALRERRATIAQGLSQAVALGAGQFCTNPGLVILTRGDEAEAFLATLRELIRRTPAGTMVHAGIRGAYESSLDAATATPGVELLAQGDGTGEHAATAARSVLLATTARAFLEKGALREEIFGPATLAVLCDDAAEMLEVARSLGGQLTATVHGSEDEQAASDELLRLLRARVGRLIWNGFPTGVEVTHAMHHGGPYPASTDARSTSVGTAAIQRFARPVCYQDLPPQLLPIELTDANPRGIWRQIDGQLTRGAVDHASA
ncbi:MAG: aldehyde dehydrogenase (NADP(+)) [Candidatus Eisenbacteria bacterium]